MATREGAEGQESERPERIQESVKIYSPSKLDTLLANWHKRDANDEEKPPETHSGVPPVVTSDNHD